MYARPTAPKFEFKFDVMAYSELVDSSHQNGTIEFKKQYFYYILFNGMYIRT